MALTSIPASLVLDYLSIEESAAFAMTCRQYRGYTVSYWRTHSLVIKDASVPPDLPDSEKFVLCIPPRVRQLAIPSRLYAKSRTRLSNVECLLLTNTTQEGDSTVLRPENLPRLRRIYFNSNVHVFIGDFPIIDCVSVTGMCHRENFKIGNRPSANIQRLNINIDNLTHYKVDTSHVSISTKVNFTLTFHPDVKEYAYIKVTCPDEVSICVMYAVSVDRLIIDAPNVRFCGDPIRIGELHVQAHLWWELRKYKPHLLTSDRSSCSLS